MHSFHFVVYNNVEFTIENRRSFVMMSYMYGFKAHSPGLHICLHVLNGRQKFSA